MMREIVERRVASGALLVIGLLVILVGANVIPVDPDRLNAPRWLLATVGVLVMSAGGAVAAREGTPASLTLTAIAVSLLSLTFGWAGLLGKAEAFGGGLPFVSSDLNARIALILFVGMSVVIAGVAALVWKDAVRAHRSSKVKR